MEKALSQLVSPSDDCLNYEFARNRMVHYISTSSGAAIVLLILEHSKNIL
jgi:hypothetical protein